MITKNETIQVLQSINDRLNLNTPITTAMVEAHHITLSKQNIDIVKSARDHFVSDWDKGYFPKPAHFREYVLSAGNKANVDKEPFDKSDFKIGPNDNLTQDLKSRVRRLCGTSERNIAIRAANKDKSREKCAKCDKLALMNLTADDYFIYWGMDTPEKFKGTRRCGPCTDRMNKELGKSAKVRRG